MISTDKIAVVILNWNGCEMMRQFLPSVVAHSADEGLVIVADNGSTGRFANHACAGISFGSIAEVKRKLWFCRGLQTGF